MFPLLLSEWSFTIYLMPCNRKYNVLSVLLNKTFPSFLLHFFLLISNALNVFFLVSVRSLLTPNVFCCSQTMTILMQETNSYRLVHTELHSRLFIVQQCQLMYGRSEISPW